MLDTSEILVIIGGAGLIALTLWYFFGEREKRPPKRMKPAYRK